MEPSQQLSPFAPHPFSLRQLQYAVAVADHLSFSRAAKACHVSQPSLSAQLMELETALGVRLFERDRRGVVMTPAGRTIITAARSALLEASSVLATARRSKDPLAGPLRLGIIPTIAPYLLPALTPVLRANLPNLTAFWTEERTDTLVEALDRGHLDGMVVALEARIGTVESEVIAKDSYLLAARPDDPLNASAGPVPLTALEGREVLLLDDGHCMRDHALAICSKAKAHELAFRATSLATLTQIVASGTGITVIPELAAAAESQRSGLQMKRFAAPEPYRTIGLAWRRHSPFAAAMHRLAEIFREAYPKSNIPRKPVHRHERRSPSHAHAD